MKSARARLAAGIAALVLTACAPHGARDVPPILLFDGTGASTNDVAALKAILKRGGLSFEDVDSSRLNGMDEPELRARRLLIVPGGNFIAIGSSLTPGTAAKVRNAVRVGLNYLGICAGGILAGNAPDNGFNLTEGVRFDFYADVNRGVHKSAVKISGPGAPAIEHYWEDGPQFTGWGAVVGRYPDGTPAIVEGRSGKGWVLLVGTHPEAPEAWRRGMAFTTPADAANAVAERLVGAALSGTSLAHD